MNSTILNGGRGQSFSYSLNLLDIIKVRVFEVLVLCNHSVPAGVTQTPRVPGPAPGSHGRNESSHAVGGMNSNIQQQPQQVHEGVVFRMSAATRPSSSSVPAMLLPPQAGLSASTPIAVPVASVRSSRSPPEIIGNQNSGVLGICDDKRKLAESTHQISGLLSQYARRTGVDISNVEDLITRPIKKQDITGLC